jgi:hypothetical protein
MDHPDSGCSIHIEGFASSKSSAVPHLRISGGLTERRKQVAELRLLLEHEQTGKARDDIITAGYVPFWRVCLSLVARLNSGWEMPCLSQYSFLAPPKSDSGRSGRISNGKRLRVQQST